MTWGQNNTGKLKNGHLADWLGLYLSLFLLDNWATVWKMGDKTEEITEPSGNEGRLSSWQKDSFQFSAAADNTDVDQLTEDREAAVQRNVCAGSSPESELAICLCLIWWLPWRGGKEDFMQRIFGRTSDQMMSDLTGPEDPWSRLFPSSLPAAGPNAVRAEKGGPGDRLVTIFNITLLDLSLSLSLFRPSCHKLYRNQDEALFQMCVMVSLGSDSTEKLHTQRSTVKKEPEYWTKVALFCIKRTVASAYLWKTHTHTAICNTLNRLVYIRHRLMYVLMSLPRKFQSADFQMTTPVNWLECQHCW